MDRFNTGIRFLITHLQKTPRIKVLDKIIAFIEFTNIARRSSTRP
jgi:hypothetical protein